MQITPNLPFNPRKNEGLPKQSGNEASKAEKPKQENNLISQFAHLIPGAAQRAESKASAMRTSLDKIAADEGLPAELVYAVAAMTPSAEGLIDLQGGKQVV